MTVLVRCNECGATEKASYSESEGYEEPFNWVANGVHKHICKSCLKKLS